VEEERTGCAIEVGDGDCSFERDFANLTRCVLSCRSQELDGASSHLCCQLLRGQRIPLVTPKSGVVSDCARTIRDNPIALLETGDVLPNFYNRA
jgi:hypothetical protein